MTMSFRRTFAGLAAFAAMAAPLAATAADLGPGRPPARYADPPYERRAAEIETWTGFYAGVAAGYATGSTGVLGGLGDYSFDQSGGVAAFYAGYNWQSGMTVFGLEAEIGTGNLGGSGTGLVSGVTSELRSLSALRARLGVLVTPRLLVYATGGIAAGSFSFNLSDGPTRSDTFVGYQVGLGGEYLINPHWALRLEYLYTDLSKERVDFPAAQSQFDPDFHTVRAGLSFRF